MQSPSTAYPPGDLSRLLLEVCDTKNTSTLSASRYLVTPNSPEIAIEKRMTPGNEGAKESVQLCDDYILYGAGKVVFEPLDLMAA